MVIDRLFAYLIPRRDRVISGFKIVYLTILVIIAVGARSIYHGDRQAVFFYRLGVDFGRVALVLYIITLLPGIGQRFGLRHKLLSILRIFRRYLGISMYLLVLAHFLLVKVVITLAAKQLVTSRLFEVFGFIALIMLLLLFITSNDFSLTVLDIWWYRLHKLTYLIMGLIFLHVALQRISLWTILMVITLILMIGSWFWKGRGKAVS